LQSVLALRIWSNGFSDLDGTGLPKEFIGWFTCYWIVTGGFSLGYWRDLLDVGSWKLDIKTILDKQKKES